MMNHSSIMPPPFIPHTFSRSGMSVFATSAFAFFRNFVSVRCVRRRLRAFASATYARTQPPLTHTHPTGRVA